MCNILDPKDVLGTPLIFRERHVVVQLRIDLLLTIILSVIYIIKGEWYFTVAGIICGLLFKGILSIPGIFIFIYPPYLLIQALFKDEEQ